MEAILFVLLGLAMAGVLGVLGFGLFTMARGGSPGRTNKIMQYRVLLQGAALLIFALFMMLFRR